MRKIIKTIGEILNSNKLHLILFGIGFVVAVATILIKRELDTGYLLILLYSFHNYHEGIRKDNQIKKLKGLINPTNITNNGE